MNISLFFSRLAVVPPRVAGVVDMLVGCAVSLLFFRISSWAALSIIVLVRVVWWAVALVIVANASVTSRRMYAPVLTLFALGAVGMLLCLDRFSYSWYGTLAIFSFLPGLGLALLPSLRAELSFMMRPHARVGVAMTMFGLAGTAMTAGAMFVFGLLSFWYWCLLILAQALFSVGAAVIWWRFYVPEADRHDLVVAGSVFGVALLHILGMLYLWPVGFLVQGVLAAWIWYLGWLTVRYYMSDEGITWRIHGFVITVHSIGMAFFLFIVRR